MRTSVVVVTYRPTHWLERALASVADQADEVILVDNASEGVAAASAASSAGARVVRLPANLGFAAGVNRGVASSTGDVVALLNDDAVAGPEWLAQAAATLASPDVAAVAPKLLLAPTYAELRFADEPWSAPGDPRPLGRMLHEVSVNGRDVLPDLLGGIYRVEEGPLAGERRRWRWTAGRDAVYVPLQDGDQAASIVVDGVATAPVRLADLVNSAGSYLSIEGHAGDHGWLATDDGQFDHPRDTFAVCGAAMAFTRSTFERVGPFAERYFAYYEDIDWCWRARLLGFRVSFDPTAVVRHARSVTSGGEADGAVRLLSGRNRIHTLARNAPIPVLARQLRRLRNPDLPSELARVAGWRALVGLAERTSLRRRWTLTPREVWSAWAGVDERWADPGRAAPPPALPPRLEFGN